jgi:hypothetical protein
MCRDEKGTYILTRVVDISFRRQDLFVYYDRRVTFEPWNLGGLRGANEPIIRADEVDPNPASCNM